MHKKKYLVLLSIMLYMLLSVLFSTSYAVTPSKVKNMLNTVYTKVGFDETKREIEIAKLDDEWLESYNYDNIGIMVFQETNTTNCYIAFINISETVSKHPYRYNYSSTSWRINNLYVVGQLQTSVATNASGRFQYSTNTNVNGNYFIYKTTGSIYTDVDVYSASNGGTIVYAAGTGSPSTFTPDGPYTDMSEWGVIYYPYDSVIINGIDTPNSNIYLSNFDTIYSPIQTWSGAWLGGADEIKSVESFYYRYNVIAKKWFKQNNQLNASLTTIDESDNSTWLYFNNYYVVSDSFVVSKIHHISDSSKDYTVYFYLNSANTAINNGVLDITQTIKNYELSGDNAYTNNSNDISNEEFRDELLSTTLDSGDEPSFEDLPSISIESGDDPSNDFFTWLLLQVQDVLNYSGDTVLNVPIWKTNYPIRSDVFKLTIEPLRTFISAGWWFIVGVPVLKFIRSSINKLKGGEIPASDEKSDLLNNVL